MFYSIIIIFCSILMLVSRRLKKSIIYSYSQKGDDYSPNAVMKILGNDNVTVFLAILVLGIIAISFFSKEKRIENRQTFLNEASYNIDVIGAEYMGKSLSLSLKSGSKALILFKENNEVQAQLNKKLLDALKKGFGDRVFVTAVETFGKIDPAITMDREDISKLLLITPDFFDKSINKYPQCDVVVSFIGLPINFEEMSLWEMSNKPKLAIFTDTVYNLGFKIGTQEIDTVVIRNPDTFELTSLSNNKDLETNFKKYFILLNAINLKKSIQENRKLFKTKIAI